MASSTLAPATNFFDLTQYGMSKILTLSIKQKYFDEILAGKKKKETREIRPTNAGKYIYYHTKDRDYTTKEVDDIPDDVDVELKAIKYDALKLLTGAYNGKRPYIIVEVKDANPYVITDDNGEDVVYEYEGKEYLLAEIEYDLGEILEKHLDV